MLQPAQNLSTADALARAQALTYARQARWDDLLNAIHPLAGAYDEDFWRDLFKGRSLAQGLPDHPSLPWKPLIAELKAQGHHLNRTQFPHTLAKNPAMLAVEAQDPEGLAALLEGGVDVQYQLRSGQTVFSMALRQPELLAIVLANGYRLGGGHVAHEEDWSAALTRDVPLESLRLLLARGASPNHYVQSTRAPYEGRTWASMAQTPEQLCVLLEAGADLTLPDRQGHPMHHHLAPAARPMWHAWRTGQALVEDVPPAPALPKRRM